MNDQELEEQALKEFVKNAALKLKADSVKIADKEGIPVIKRPYVRHTDNGVQNLVDAYGNLYPEDFEKEGYSNIEDYRRDRDLYNLNQKEEGLQSPFQFNFLKNLK